MMDFTINTLHSPYQLAILHAAWRYFILDSNCIPDRTEHRTRNNFPSVLGIYLIEDEERLK